MDDAPKPQKKMKFLPKAPPRRGNKLLLPKLEKVEDTDLDDHKEQDLLKRFNELSKRPKIKPDIKPLQKQVSSFSLGFTASPKSEGADDATSSTGIKEYKEPWDYCKYYPATLPIRRPYSGNPELLDEQEFKEDSQTNAHKESSLTPAQELGLMKEDSENMLIFIQLPPTLPLPKQSIKTEGGGSSKPLKDIEPPSKGCNLNELPAGVMGKMLVYKSGAVKLKLGDHLYNVSGGQECTFAQDVVAIHTEEKSCCNIGELNKRAIITPDLDSILESIKDL
ncbi:hypothetical protein QVD17_29567 [Tagetes erecta]|uniref:DNA-directed RNA polymerase III subunit RPC4 n=1 Tax=Tagetes erecta TaxID=13708 RepID=A0AAD8K3R3_TARER|nr:hypothetical protein QVD17_29567 [Tagetes erecta]